MNKKVVGLFGRKKKIKTSVLPSKSDVLRYYLWLESSTESVFPIIVQKIMEIWSSTGIPTVTKRMVTKSLQNLHENYRYFSKNSARKRTTTYRNKLVNFKEELKCLFDIAECKCHDSDCVKHKLSNEQRTFLIDQRTLKTLKISIDAGAVSDHNDDGEKDEEEEYVSEDENNNSDEANNDPDYVVPTKKRRLAYNTLDISKVSVVADRYRASNTLTAAIATATLESVGLVTPDKTHLVIDNCKVARSRDKMRNSFNSQEDFIGLYCDGRKDTTLFVEKEEGGVNRKSLRKEEHVSLVGQPGNKFLQYIPLDKGCAVDFLAGMTFLLWDVMGRL